MKREPLLTVNLTAEEYKTLFNHDINTYFVEPVSDLIGYGITTQQRDHWAKLHTTLMDSTTFTQWVDAIPGCATCKRDFLELIKINPPRFDDWHRWTYEVHNAVNRKLGKTEIEWEKACELWGWE